MRPGDRGVHRQRPINQPRRVCGGHELREHPIPGVARRHHPVMPRPHRLPQPEYLRQITPRDPGPIPVNDRLDHRASVRELPSGASVRVRQHLLDQRPLNIRKHLKARHALRLSAQHPSLCQPHPNRGRDAVSVVHTIVSSLAGAPVMVRGVRNASPVCGRDLTRDPLCSAARCGTRWSR